MEGEVRRGIKAVEIAVVDVYMKRLRRKIDEPFGRRTLETIRGSGYRLRADGGE